MFSCTKSKPVPTEFDVNKAINIYYDQNECYIPLRFPKFISDSEDQVGYIQLVEEGVLKVSQTLSDFKTSNGIVKDVKTNRYELTDYGQTFYLKNKGLKVASLVMPKIIKISETSTFKGLPMVVIQFEFEPLIIQPWYNEDVEKTFSPMMSFNIPRSKIIKEEKIVFQNEAWIHVNDLEKSK
jgi:hypothetical protein